MYIKKPKEGTIIIDNKIIWMIVRIYFKAHQDKMRKRRGNILQERGDR